MNDSLKAKITVFYSFSLYLLKIHLKSNKSRICEIKIIFKSKYNTPFQSHEPNVKDRPLILYFVPDVSHTTCAPVTAETDSSSTASSVQTGQSSTSNTSSATGGSMWTAVRCSKYYQRPFYRVIWVVLFSDWASLGRAFPAIFPGFLHRESLSASWYDWHVWVCSGCYD